jgi:hypothetical protein
MYFLTIITLIVSSTKLKRGYRGRKKEKGKFIIIEVV